MPLHRRGALRVMAMAVAGSLYRIRYDGTQHRFRRYFLHGPRKGISECRLARTRILGHTIGRPPDTALAVQANCAIALNQSEPATMLLTGRKFQQLLVLIGLCAIRPIIDHRNLLSLNQSDATIFPPLIR